MGSKRTLYIAGCFSLLLAWSCDPAHESSPAPVKETEEPAVEPEAQPAQSLTAPEVPPPTAWDPEQQAGTSSPAPKNNEPTEPGPENGGDDPTDTETPEEPTKVCSVCEDIPMLDSRTEYPIVLAHGMGGFESFWFLEYWGGSQERMRDEGFAVYTSVVDPMNGSDLRAQQLSKFIDRVLECTCADKVNLIAHSQGGIDARVLVDVMGYHDRVESVTTMSSPHGGSPVADRLLELVPGEWDPVVDLLVYLVSEIYTDPLEQVEVRNALTWVSTDFMAQFNEDYPPHEDVTWYSYAGRAGLLADGEPECENAMLPNPGSKNTINAPFLPGWTLIGGLQGVDNDGLIPVESAKFGTFLGCVSADHVQEIGMFWGTLPLFDHQQFYLDHAVRLEEWGH